MHPPTHQPAFHSIITCSFIYAPSNYAIWEYIAPFREEIDEDKPQGNIYMGATQEKRKEKKYARPSFRETPRLGIDNRLVSPALTHIYHESVLALALALSLSLRGAWTCVWMCEKQVVCV